MTRYVKDGVIILQAIAGLFCHLALGTIGNLSTGKDEYDPETLQIPFQKIPDYPAACVRTALQGAQVAAGDQIVFENCSMLN